jgi:hypothetical protein
MAEPGCDPVCDDRRPVGIGHRSDAVKAFLIAHADPLVPAQMLLPGCNHELLDEAPRLGAVAPHAPKRSPPSAGD